VAAKTTLFLGKGGVGRTTLAAAFALARAEAGERVLLVGLVEARDLVARLAAEGGRVPATLDVSGIDPRGLLDDIVRKMVPMGALSDAVVKSPAYASLADIAPGAKELAVLNRVWNLAREGRYDRIVLDGPATGHGLHFLEAPRKAAAILAGRLRERALVLDTFVRDPAATSVVLVTLPEETPVRETVELARALARDGIPVTGVVVNRWVTPVFETPGSKRVLDRLAADAGARRDVARALAGASREDVDALVAASELLDAQRREAVEHRERLADVGAPIAYVPWTPATEGRLVAVARSLEGIA